MNAARAVAVRLNKRRLWPRATYATCVAAAALGSVALTQTTSARTESSDLAVRRTWPQWPADKRLPVCADVGQLYNLDSVIGRGGFGLVHEGRDRQSQAPVAIKRVCKQSTSKDKFLQEVEILRAMGGQHNVVGLCEAFETTDAYVLVTELVEGEELFEHLVNKGVFSEQRARRLVHQIAQTLEYLHEHRVVHGDLKPENILLSSDASHMRLIDFGQSFREHVSAERSRCLGGGVATVAYAAPEVIKLAKRPTSVTAGSAIDMWGLGVVLYIVLCGYHPFDADNNASDKELALRIASGLFDKDSAEWHDLEPEARDLIEKLLEVDPSRRLTAEEVLSHKWLAPVLSN